MSDSSKPTSALLLLFTRTPLHVGAGESVGAIDQPIVRERPTGFPIVPGSGLKGVLRETCRRDDTLKSLEKQIFGDETGAGRLSFGEAKILAFPVRSARGSFAFVTCPLALERFRRERGQDSTKPKLTTPPEPAEMHCLAGESVIVSRAGKSDVVLEEYKFTRDGAFPADWEKVLVDLLDDDVWKVARNRLVLLNNGNFGHFVKNACDVSQHVGLDPEKGTAKDGALFNLEAVPAETLFFAPITLAARGTEGLDSLDRLRELLDRKPVLQFGGDSTTGLGFCTVRLA